MGYGGSRREAGEAIGHAGDEGIDGIIKEDRLGLDIIYIQAKALGEHGRPPGGISSYFWGDTPVSDSQQRTAEIPATWVTEILQLEQNDVRFEAFATDLVSTLEGQPVLRTSQSWDLGRDGRGYGARRGVWVLTTLRTDSRKALQDASRLKSTHAPIKHIYYVAPRAISEQVLENHSRAIRDVVGDAVRVDPLGRPQIAALVSSGKDGLAFSRHYAGELASITNVLARDASEPQFNHLELALCTFGAKDTRELRAALNSRLILRLLEARHCSVDDLAAGAAQVLGVPAFSRSTVQHYCGLLSERGHIEERYSLYEITDAGRQAIAAGNEGVVQNELSGRTAVRRAVEESLGNTIPEQQWAYIWTDIQKGLAYAFYVRGKEVLDVISHLVDGDRSVEQRGILALLVNNVLKKAIEDHAAPPRRLHLLRAFQDAFLPGDKHGAFEWLAGVAGRFAATCTLGLSADILSVLAQTLRKMRFFADTDVVVSYLCAHEPANAAASAILALSKRVGNRMLITDAVVEETARHAMKAYTDYKVRVSPIQKPLDWWEIADLESAFTREFEYLRAEGKAKASQWSQFIARYAGPENYSKQRYTPDTSKMRSILNADGFGIRSPGTRDVTWEERRDAIEKVIYEESNRWHADEQRNVMKDKSRIDAEMLMTVAEVVAGSQSQGSGERYLIISSAARLRQLPSGVRAHLQDIPEVISLAEAASIAALLPEQPISLQALHAFLFEDRIGRTLGGLEARLLRIVREASSVVLPGATRGVLQEEFASVILRESKLTGETKGEVRERIGRSPAEFARVAAVAVDALAIQRPLERDEVMRRLEHLGDDGGGAD